MCRNAWGQTECIWHDLFDPVPATQVLIYIDGVKVGETSGGQKTPHLMINRMCEGETSDSDGSISTRLGFRHQLPPLPSGRHEVRQQDKMHNTCILVGYLMCAFWLCTAMRAAMLTPVGACLCAAAR
jgi:hypothetical protein